MNRDFVLKDYFSDSHNGKLYAILWALSIYCDHVLGSSFYLVFREVLIGVWRQVCFSLSVCMCICQFFSFMRVSVYMYLRVFELRICELSSLCGVPAFLLTLCWHIRIFQAVVLTHASDFCNPGS